MQTSILCPPLQARSAVGSIGARPDATSVAPEIELGETPQALVVGLQKIT